MTKRTKTDYIIVHHSATARDTTTFESIKRWHVEHNGWDNIGYHRVITGDGTVYKGMPENMVGYHCLYSGFNYKSIGICLTGNFCTGQEIPSPAQLRKLTQILDELTEKYKIPKGDVLGHRETGASTACPGIGLINWLKDYRSGIIEEEMTEEEVKQLLEKKADKDDLDPIEDELHRLDQNLDKVKEDIKKSNIDLAAEVNGLRIELRHADNLIHEKLDKLGEEVIDDNTGEVEKPEIPDVFGSWLARLLKFIFGTWIR